MWISPVKHLAYVGFADRIVVIFGTDSEGSVMERVKGSPLFPSCKLVDDVFVHGSPWLRGHRHLTENKDLKGCGFNPQQPMASIFQPRIAKKINQAPSVRVIVICCDQDSY